jgi:hypothetical protein
MALSRVPPANTPRLNRIRRSCQVRHSDKISRTLKDWSLSGEVSKIGTSMIKDKEICKAWERFIEGGTAPATVRAVVASSWQRSQELGVPVERQGAPQVPEADLAKGHSIHSALVEAALGKSFLEASTSFCTWSDTYPRSLPSAPA